MEIENKKQIFKKDSEILIENSISDYDQILKFLSIENIENELVILENIYNLMKNTKKIQNIIQLEPNKREILYELFQKFKSNSEKFIKHQANQAIFITINKIFQQSNKQKYIKHEIVAIADDNNQISRYISTFYGKFLSII